MTVRTISRAGVPSTKRHERRKPRVGAAARSQRGEELLEKLGRLEDGKWVRVSFRCVRCMQTYSVCLNTMVETLPDQPCEQGCEWKPAGLFVDKGAKPWKVDMPGTYGPGDRFYAELGDRVFIGGKRRPGEWRSITREGQYLVDDRGRPHLEDSDAAC